MDRRRFLQASALSLVSAAVFGLSACDGDDEGDDDGNRGDLGPPLGTPRDRAALLSAHALERTAIATYNTLLEARAVSRRREGVVAQGVQAFRDHHERHRDALAEALRARRTLANKGNHAGLRRRVDSLSSVSGEDDVLTIAAIVENAAAASYTLRSTELDDAELRGLLLSFAAIDAGHDAWLRLQRSQAALRSDAHWPTNDALALRGNE